MLSTPAATSVQLARAEAIGRTLTRTGWTPRLEDPGTHPGAAAATVHTRLGVTLLILTLGGRHGQMIEITAQAATETRGLGARRVRPVRPSWRLTAYDPPPAAVLAAAAAACDNRQDRSPLETAGWDVTHVPAHSAGPNARKRVRATAFTRPDGAVTATFHAPRFAPPCERCVRYGELGDTGGWLIQGPGFTAEATAHTPASVIGAFTRALPGTTPTSGLPVNPRRRDAQATVSAPATSVLHVTKEVR